MPPIQPNTLIKPKLIFIAREKTNMRISHTSGRKHHAMRMEGERSHGRKRMGAGAEDWRACLADVRGVEGGA